jgi:hypothetical protein
MRLSVYKQAPGFCPGQWPPLCLKRKYDELLSRVAFKFDLHPCIQAEKILCCASTASSAGGGGGGGGAAFHSPAAFPSPAHWKLADFGRACHIFIATL